MTVGNYAGLRAYANPIRRSHTTMCIMRYNGNSASIPNLNDIYRGYYQFPNHIHPIYQTPNPMPSITHDTDILTNTDSQCMKRSGHADAKMNKEEWL